MSRLFFIINIIFCGHYFEPFVCERQELNQSTGVIELSVVKYNIEILQLQIFLPLSHEFQKYFCWLELYNYLCDFKKYSYFSNVLDLCA